MRYGLRVGNHGSANIDAGSLRLWVGLRDGVDPSARAAADIQHIMNMLQRLCALFGGRPTHRLGEQCLLIDHVGIRRWYALLKPTARHGFRAPFLEERGRVWHAVRPLA